MCAKQTGKIYYSMGEVTEMFDVNPSLIRFWESKFDILKPHKNKKGNRLFTPADVENLKLIYHLVKEKGMTLSGAQKQIKANREGVSRDLEVIDRLLGIKALLTEIKQEMGMGPALETGPEEEYLPVLATEDEDPAESGKAGELTFASDEVDMAAEKEYDAGSGYIGEGFIEDLPETPERDEHVELCDQRVPSPQVPLAEQVQQIVSQNITEIAGGELPQEYIGELSDEIAEEAATAAEVMETLAELEKAQDKKGPHVYEQTLF